MLTENRGTAGTEPVAGRRVMVREAQIKTALVEIRALTISGRQVTQSVFWQLEREDIIDDGTFALCGTPWGRVNYFRAPCKDDHLHVVWQKGEELRRACVFEQGYRDSFDYNEARYSAEQKVGDLRAWQLLRHEMPSEGSGRPQAYRAEGCYFSYMQPVEYVNYQGPRLGYALPGWAFDAQRYGLSSRQKEATEHVRQMEEGFQTPQGLHAAIAMDVCAMKQAQERWAKRWAELCALDQLFIAV